MEGGTNCPIPNLLPQALLSAALIFCVAPHALCLAAAAQDEAVWHATALASSACCEPLPPACVCRIPARGCVARYSSGLQRVF